MRNNNIYDEYNAIRDNCCTPRLCRRLHVKITFSVRCKRKYRLNSDPSLKNPP